MCDATECDNCRVITTYIMGVAVIARLTYIMSDPTLTAMLKEELQSLTVAHGSVLE